MANSVQKRNSKPCLLTSSNLFVTGPFYCATSSWNSESKRRLRVEKEKKRKENMLAIHLLEMDIDMAQKELLGRYFFLHEHCPTARCKGKQSERLRASHACFAYPVDMFMNVHEHERACFSPALAFHRSQRKSKRAWRVA